MLIILSTLIAGKLLHLLSVAAVGFVGGAAKWLGGFCMKRLLKE
jgi:hypothetical protein